MDPFAAHRQHMHSMFSGFSFDPFLSITDGHTPAGRAPARRQQPATAANPFNMLGLSGGFMDMFGMMNSMMENMDQMSSNPCQTFSSSTVISYSNMGGSTPKVYQETSQTRNAPGGIRETRRTMRDSESGIERMSIGHHIRDRAHIMERARNHRTGDREERQDFINLDESEAAAFDDEWRRETSRYGAHRSLDYQRSRARHGESPRLAILGTEEQAHSRQSRRYDW
ncbi:myeloid leukemia factor 2 isoform X2 [Latimeria chalumnae]